MSTDVADTLQGLQISDAPGTASGSGASSSDAPAQASTSAAGPSQPPAPPAKAACAGSSAEGTSGPTSGDTAAARPQIQFAADDPDYPYTTSKDIDTELMLMAIEQRLKFEYVLKYQGSRKFTIPAEPKTAKEATKLRAQFDKLHEEGKYYEAIPYVFQLAKYCLRVLGSEHPDTLDVIWIICENAYQSGGHAIIFYEFALPRAALHLGLGHPHTRQLVYMAAQSLDESPDPRAHGDFNKVVYRVAKNLPGGLGWGTAAVTPLADQETFNKTAFMQEKAEVLFRDGTNPRLAKSMFERCIAYYETLGPHWLASPRKARSRQLLALCVCEIDGPDAAEPIVIECKRVAKVELGPHHMATLQSWWQHGNVLLKAHRKEQAMSMFQKTVQLRKQIAGPRHISVLESEVAIGMILVEADHLTEAHDLLANLFDRVVMAGGPKGILVEGALRAYWDVLFRLGRRKDALALRARAAKLGCDVECCC